ncbi:hypothetical protein HXX76_011093 [Chlamydomonas incerta]|uniref:Cyclin-like domain-containing protein n=1 Tax=Chlamydomonas incerta TaxID=51695 RepID=A0A835VY46_CHLIN|nr:hypothetical protein HXX76_011093 [Chlamydomonas incerta]|eukprot:KAG2429326.1 hypothetical protein HXX76_011093 [Chlamydomonas incerta]
MVWCAQCSADVEVETDDQNGFACCVQCGRVVEDTAFSSDVMFTKGGDGEGEMVGQMVGASGEARGLGRYSGGRMWGSGGDSHEAAVSRGRHEIVSLVEALRISPSGEAVEAAHRLYRLALQRNFTRGRRVNQVAAVCLYIFCRLERRPYMLIDFSDHLSVNVYALGAVFLQLLKLLRLDEHATLTKPIDPSIFLNRFVDRLRLPTQDLKTKVGNTAMRLVQSMKRDWMLTGRRPSGVCGAALFLAAHIHGVEKTKRDVIAIVHIGWATVEKRVMELAETRDAELTLKELGERDKAVEEQREQLLLEYERQAIENPQRPPALMPPPEPADGEGGDGGGAEGGGGAVVGVDPNEVGRFCEHVRAGATLLAHGMCRGCLEDYLVVTQAAQGTNDPPCYIANLRRDVKKRVREQLAAERGGLLIKGSGEVLALPGPSGSAGAGGSGSGGGEDAFEDLQRRRHLENEEALEAGTSGEPAQQQDKGTGKDGAIVAVAAAGGGRRKRAKAGESAGDGSAGPSAAAGGAGAAAAGGGTGAYGSRAEDGTGAGPSSAGAADAAAAAGGGAAVAGGRRAAALRSEEDDFDAALHSSELQPLARALGGEAAAVATAPLRGAASPGPEQEAAAGEAAAEEDAARAKRRRAEASEAGAAAAGAAAPAAAGAAATAAAAQAEAEAEAGGAGGAGGISSAMAAAADAERRAAAAAAAAAPAAAAADEGDEEEEALSDHLSDVEDDDIGCYLATSEEASIRESLWVEMNKDWIEKQEVKRREAEEAAKDPSKAGSDKAKRKYNRKPKAEMPAAEDAAAAARNILEAKKLSNKINYGALEDLFGGGGEDGGGAAWRRSASPDPPVAPPSAGFGGSGRSTAAAAAAAAFADDLAPRPLVAAALAKRAAERARAQAADADKYAAALEDEQRKRVGGGGGGGGGGLGGGFLDSLTFARGGAGGGEGGRARPAGLSLRPRGR